MVSRNYYAKEKLKRKVKAGLAIAATGLVVGGGIFGLSKAAKSSTNSDNKAKVVNVQQQPTLVRNVETVKNIYHEKHTVHYVKDPQTEARAREAEARAQQAEADLQQANAVIETQAQIINSRPTVIGGTIRTVLGVVSRAGTPPPPPPHHRPHHRRGRNYDF